MAKKSAKSKGYRSYKKEKPFLTKKEIYALIAIVAVILVGFIVFVTYDDGALKVKDGQFVDKQDNWVVINGNTVSAPRYYKVAEAGEIEGYTLQPRVSYTDINMTDVYYYPETEENPVDYISLSGSSIKNNTIESLGGTVVESLGNMEGYAITSPLTEAKVGDTEYSYYGFTYEYYTEPEVTEEPVEEAAPAEEAGEPAPNTFGQALNAYVATAHDGCVMIHVVNTTDAPENYMTDEEMKAVIEQVITAAEFDKK